MSKFLVSTTETYRVDTESEVKTLIEEAKASNIFELKQYNCEHKQKKEKGEIVDEWFRVTLKKTFNDEKDPYSDISVGYEHIGTFNLREEIDE